MVGQTVSHYKIIEKLGEGGMGVVYKAEDTHLKRTVALKLLPRGLESYEVERARFLQEARAASLLNHPQICTIHSLGEHEGQQFIDMEYVDGVTLRKKIDECKAKKLFALQDAIAYAIQICEALEEAHSKGIVHRDVKPENIMVNSKNQIKVMDFGLAKLKGSVKLTKTSSTIGTLAYMSPEQIKDGHTDARSDIFSCGIVLYEMLSGGSLPFRGEHEAALVYSIVNEEPTPVQRYRADVSSELLHILDRSLEKDAEDRYQTIHEMLIDLRRLKKETTRVVRGEMLQADGSETSALPQEGRVKSANHINKKRRRAFLYTIAGIILLAVAVAGLFIYRSGTSQSVLSAAEKKMLVVLPFENLGSPDQEYFAEGMTEEITTRLSGLSGLGVIARSSAAQYKKTTKTLQQIGEELHVAYALQGTIRWEQTPDGGTEARVSPALIKISDATQVWSEPYESKFSDVFKMQSEIATEVASALGVTLLQPERKTLETHLTDNLEAYSLYIRGDEYSDRTDREPDSRIAVQMYEKAVALDPKFAQAYAQLSRAHSKMYWMHYDHTKERIAKAKEAVDVALKLNPDLPEAHVALGYYYYWGNLDYDNALKEFALAEKNRPNDAQLIYAIGNVQRRQGKFDLASKSMAKGCELDPRSSVKAYNMGQTYMLIRDYPEAEREFVRANTLSPDVIDPYVNQAWLYLVWDGATRRARSTIGRALKISGAEEDQEIIFIGVLIEFFDKRYQNALHQLSLGTSSALDNQFEFVPKAQVYAEVYGLMKELEKQRRYYDSSRIMIEEKLRELPDDARLHSALGIAYAGLGRKEDAIREAMHGVELLPISKEAWRGTYRVRDLAYVYVQVGEYDAAIEQLQIILSVPSYFSLQYLRLDPRWALLWNNPRFQQLVTEKR